MPVRHHYTNNQRLGDVILDMQNRWTVARNSRSYCLKGNHGFDNLYKSMQALFVAHGPDFRQGIESDPFENIELYNLMCELLKISPAPNNGTMGSLNHLLRRPPAIPTTNRTMSPVCSHNKEDSIPDRNCYCKNKVKSFTSTTVYSSPFGKPEISVAEDVCILSTNDTASGYSKTHKMPVWTSFILYPNKTVDNMTGSCVNIDPRVQLLSCSSYRNDNMSISHHFIVNSGFSVKNSDLEKTLSSSLVPMYDGFRDGIWEYTMKLILDYGNQRSGMEVIIGSAFDNNRDGLWEDVSNETMYVGKDGVPVPTHYYIIIISCKHGDILNCITTDLELLSFILPHLPAVPNCMPDEDYLMENVARIRDIELLTGIQFLTGLPDDTAASLRTFLPTSLWKPSKMSLHWKDVPCSAPSNTKCQGKIPLLLISLDGFRADYVQRKLTPVIEKLRTCGHISKPLHNSYSKLHTPYMRSVYPTVTFPNHYTIATGLYPESHGIISNNMYDADIGEVFSLSSHTKMDPRWWGGEPIWNTAKKQGRKAYTFFWPGSDVNISGSYPDVWVGYDGKIGFPERLEKVTEWLLLPDDKKPDIITLYFDEPDHAGHQKGPDGELLNGQLETVDDMLGRLMNTLYQEGLHDCVNLIVIADHGMQHVSCSNMVKLPQYMPDDMKNILVFDGTFGRIENDYARISKYKVKTENFTQVPVSKITDELMCKNPAMKVFTKETAPKRFHYLNNKRIGDVLLDMQDQWLVTDTNSFWCTGGNHGWDNLYKSMHALFLAHGPAFKQQLEIKPFENIELYNLMCESEVNFTFLSFGLIVSAFVVTLVVSNVCNCLIQMRIRRSKKNTQPLIDVTSREPETSREGLYEVIEVETKMSLENITSASNIRTSLSTSSNDNMGLPTSSNINMSCLAETAQVISDTKDCSGSSHNSSISDASEKSNTYVSNETQYLNPYTVLHQNENTKREHAYNDTRSSVTSVKQDLDDEAEYQ
ncbi:ectonucleotide pyrophosphatase/phosphodiesterase family member 1/3 [Mytilus galloprovincialis]|uniref:Ectonucleotide pyrophosphatase/phosphodiesterase family member 1/3 n=1 Tax=Mytilus galloprovincialis TaxID=29158 RepID=A0A8B6G9R0_MYTGA|nr:ectonucleotide pyrophosphatase/phosphodiesterase family member 1/3 [Mytilus galloprovincialis]